MILSPKDSQISLGLARAYKIFIMYLGILTILLNILKTLSKLSYEKYFSADQNVTEIANSVQKINDIIAVDLCLALIYTNIDMFLFEPIPWILESKI
jgi:Trk-type K+ transport system membrane component